VATVENRFLKPILDSFTIPKFGQLEKIRKKSATNIVARSFNNVGMTRFELF
jgi:hypothetical protein